MKLKDKVAVITGGSRGIGRAIAVAFAREGACISIASKTKTTLTEAKIKIEQVSNHKVLAVVADISRFQEARRIVKLTHRTFGKIDILVNNAGILGPVGPFINNDMDEWIRAINVNLMGTARMIRLCLPYMIKQSYGKIINLSGGGAVYPRPNFTAYGVSKAAVVRFTETLASELKDYGIDVNSLAPGGINTRMTRQILNNKNKAGAKEFLSAKKQLSEGGADPNTAASLAVFLASSDSNGLTGRLISAIWDDWAGLGSRVENIMKTDAFTVRRIEEKGKK